MRFCSTTAHEDELAGVGAGGCELGPLARGAGSDAEGLGVTGAGRSAAGG